MKSLASILAAPTLCLAVLGAVVLDGRRHTRPEDAAPFHAAAKAVIDAWPRQAGGEFTSRDWEMPKEAVQLLRPNAKIGRRYENLARQSAELLIVQCRRAEDMHGHYPPNCYGNSGERLADREERTWQVGDTTIRGMEYHFERPTLGAPERKCVYNFFVLPGRGIQPDMKSVYDATGDYQLRWYGAAQFQVVFTDDMPQQTRDEIFAAILSGPQSSPGDRPYCEQAFRTLSSTTPEKNGG